MKTIQNNIRKITLSILLILGFSVAGVSQTVVETLEIGALESVSVDGGTTIKNLIVNADKNSSGQLVVEGGVVQVEKLTYRFKFNKEEWTLIAFPSDIANIMDASSSNLVAAGYRQNIGISKVIQLKSFNPDAALNDRDTWKISTGSSILGGKAYLVAVSGRDIAEFDEVEFYFNNLNFDLSNNVSTAVVEVDLHGKALNQAYNVTISALNANSNVLNVSVFNEGNGQPHPVDFEEAVANAKLIFTEDDSAFRIVLPTNEIAKVVVMDKKMKKTIQGFEYSSPAEIPVSLFKKGNYKLLLEYGGVIGIKELKIK